LADTQCCADGAYRRETISRQVSLEREHCALTERIGRGAIVMRVGRNRRQLTVTPQQAEQLKLFAL